TVRRTMHRMARGLGSEEGAAAAGGRRKRERPTEVSWVDALGEVMLPAGVLDAAPPASASTPSAASAPAGVRRAPVRPEDQVLLEARAGRGGRARDEGKAPKARKQAPPKVAPTAAADGRAERQRV